MAKSLLACRHSQKISTPGFLRSEVRPLKTSQRQLKSIARYSNSVLVMLIIHRRPDY